MDSPILHQVDREEHYALQYIDQFLGKDLMQEELILRGLVEMFYRDKRDSLQSSIAPDGRPMFQHKLTAEEDIARWLNPITRAEVEAEKGAQGGDELVNAWRFRIANLITQKAGA